MRSISIIGLRKLNRLNQKPQRNPDEYYVRELPLTRARALKGLILLRIPVLFHTLYMYKIPRHPPKLKSKSQTISFRDTHKIFLI